MGLLTDNPFYVAKVVALLQLTGYYRKALEYAQKENITEWEVKRNTMFYKEKHPTKTYKVAVNLDNMKESREPQ